MSTPTQTTIPQSTFLDGARDALVIVFTYLPVAFAFGVAAIGFGFNSWEALFLSSTIYAGASQFIVIALLASGTSIWVAAITVIIFRSAPCVVWSCDVSANPATCSSKIKHEENRILGLGIN